MTSFAFKYIPWGFDIFLVMSSTIPNILDMGQYDVGNKQHDSFVLVCLFCDCQASVSQLSCSAKAYYSVHTCDKACGPWLVFVVSTAVIA